MNLKTTHRQKQKCEKCFKKTATRACLACGLGENFFYCTKCDDKCHQTKYKKKHQRKDLHPQERRDQNRGRSEDLAIGRINENLHNDQALSPIRSPITPTEYINAFTNPPKVEVEVSCPEYRDAESACKIDTRNMCTQTDENLEEIHPLPELLVSNNLVRTRPAFTRTQKRNRAKTLKNSREGSVDTLQKCDFKDIKDPYGSNGFKGFKYPNNPADVQALQGSFKKLGSIISTIDLEDKENFDENIRNNRIDHKLNFNTSGSICQNYEQKVTQLREKYKKSLRNLKKSFMSQLTDLKTEIARSEITHQKNKVTFVDLQNKIDSLEKQVSVQKLEILEKDSIIESLQTARFNLRSIKGSTNRTISQYQEQIDFLKQKFEAEQRKNIELEDLLKEYMSKSNLEQILQEKDIQIMTLTQELTDLKGEFFVALNDIQKDTELLRSPAEMDFQQKECYFNHTDMLG
ncbi:unnamed protein product [Moneuplotes crassus]|uniref:C2H2-type domain-containing protein n=1 Tax=Euplotes crassus TaxID=5936 RepID=A0AAD1X7E2_EUPCR|nr:unnamed protein product [Moneuplotes crassus]